MQKILSNCHRHLSSTAEQCFCKAQVTGSNPVGGFLRVYSSGQRGQTVNLLAYAYGGSNPSARIQGIVNI